MSWGKWTNKIVDTCPAVSGSADCGINTSEEKTTGHNEADGASFVVVMYIGWQNVSANSILSTAEQSSVIVGG